MSQKKEKPLQPTAREDRGTENTRAALAEGEARYRAYWLTLDPRDQDRLPAPGA